MGISATSPVRFIASIATARARLATPLRRLLLKSRSLSWLSSVRPPPASCRCRLNSACKRGQFRAAFLVGERARGTQRAGFWC